MSSNLKSLISRLDDTCRNALEAAAGLCLGRTNYEVDVEHYLLKLVEQGDTDVAHILRHFGVDTSKLTTHLTAALDRLKVGNARTPSLSPHLIRLVEDAWMVASIDYGSARIRSAHLLLSLLT
jgi:type VI secretion system protein VasG